MSFIINSMYQSFSNWSGLVTCEPAAVRAVSSIAEIRDAISAANAAGWNVRTAGTTHSHSSLVHADDGLVLLTDGLSAKPEVNAGNGTARVAAGSKLHSIGAPLWESGFSLANQGDIDVQSIGGLIGTGVHGTGRALRSISDSVVAATLITASGDLIDTSDDPDLLEAVRLNLGALGVVVDVTLNLLPGFSSARAFLVRAAGAGNGAHRRTHRRDAPLRVFLAAGDRRGIREGAASLPRPG